MKQLLKDKQLIGKTIQRTGYADGHYALFFDDDTYAVWRGCGWEGNDVELMDESYSLVPTISNAYELRDMGVISQDEYNEIHINYEANQEIRREQIELEEYNRLKQKFG